MASNPGVAWYVFTHGEVKGAYSREEVAAFLLKGILSDDAQFSRGDAWISREEFESLHSLHEADLEVIDPIDAPDRPAVELERFDSARGVSSTATSTTLEDATNRQNVNEPEIPEASIPVRDRIVVIGRRAAGKTIYLAQLYHQLWRSRDGLCMKALSGRTHKELMAVHHTLQQGQWPAATDKTTIMQMEFELTYRGRSRILVGLDYAGEVFRDAFVNDDLDSPQAKALVSHIDRAIAVMLLIDPVVAVGNSPDAMIDDDYGIVQAIQRVRDWPGSEEVPVVLLLSKADQNRRLFPNKQSIQHFIESHYPALIRTLGGFKAFLVSAVQTEADDQGRKRPRTDSVPQNVIESLKYCLDQIHKAEKHEEALAQQSADQDAMERMIRYQNEVEQRSTQRFMAVVAAIVTIGICLLVLLFVFLSE